MPLSLPALINCSPWPLDLLQGNGLEALPTVLRWVLADCFANRAIPSPCDFIVWSLILLRIFAIRWKWSAKMLCRADGCSLLSSGCVPQQRLFLARIRSRRTVLESPWVWPYSNEFTLASRWNWQIFFPALNCRMLIAECLFWISSLEQVEFCFFFQLDDVELSFLSQYFK